ncbi:unnamed protein product [Fraxinus pennsylvanica]|uniref:Uncharacterized protein n=1 Tax=Fraxinus pennsylvanica TaxID=56036 RepID=A0AAD1ZH06_9LAMI|nr:unnamed protein product [Fraxinus pennsylvanica]
METDGSRWNCYPDDTVRYSSYASSQENLKYAKYENFNCSEIYDTYGKLFGDIGDSTKYVISPTKLSQRGFDFSTNGDREFDGNTMPINAEATDSNGSPVEGRAGSLMLISGSRNDDKGNAKTGNVEGRRKCTVPEMFQRPLSTCLLLERISTPSRDRIKMV